MPKKARELTYRTEPMDPRLVHDMAVRLCGRVVVVRSKGGRWIRGKLTYVGGVHEDVFQVTTSKHAVKLQGLWRIHNQGLFTESKDPQPRVEIEPLKDALKTSAKGRRVPTRSNNNTSKGGSMATKVPAKGKKGSTKATAKSNGRAPAKTLTVAQLKTAAKMKFKDGATWNEVREALGVSTPSGRFFELWDENNIANPGPRERATPGSAKPAAKKGAAKKGAAKKGKKVVPVVRRGKGKSNPS